MQLSKQQIFCLESLWHIDTVIFLRGYFRRNYPLRGRDWLRRVSDEDRAAFARVGNHYARDKRSGGLARAAAAARDEKGRFISNGGAKCLA